jgi:hypothetical protein
MQHLTLSPVDATRCARQRPIGRFLKSRGELSPDARFIDSIGCAVRKTYVPVRICVYPGSTLRSPVTSCLAESLRCRLHFQLAPALQITTSQIRRPMQRLQRAAWIRAGRFQLCSQRRNHTGRPMNRLCRRVSPLSCTLIRLTDYRRHTRQSITWLTHCPQSEVCHRGPLCDAKVIHPGGTRDDHVASADH